MFVAFAAIAIAVVGCSGSAVRKQPGFELGETRIRTIAILPTETELLILNLLGGDEAQEAKQTPYRSLDGTFVESLADILKVYGFDVRRLPVDLVREDSIDRVFTASKIATTGFFAGSPGTERYKEQDKPIVSEEDRAAIADLKVDAFLYTRYERRCETTGRRLAKELLLLGVEAAAIANGGTPTVRSGGSCGAYLEASLIDDATGKVIMATRVTSRRESSPDKMAEQAVLQLLRTR